MSEEKQRRNLKPIVARSLGDVVDANFVYPAMDITHNLVEEGAADHDEARAEFRAAENRKGFADVPGDAVRMPRVDRILIKHKPAGDQYIHIGNAIDLQAL